MARPKTTLPKRIRYSGEPLPASEEDLPKDMLWVYNHPYFSQRKVGGYPPAPTQGAETMFKMCKNDEKYRLAFFKQCSTALLKLHEKRDSVSESRAEVQERKSIQELRELIVNVLEDAGLSTEGV